MSQFDVGRQQVELKFKSQYQPVHVPNLTDLEYNRTLSSSHRHNQGIIKNY